jgi:sigma-B regulation protein RsbU (phosphoserine phosphatase)
MLMDNALDDPRIIKHDDPSLEVRSVIVVPISFRDNNLGVLAIVNPSDGGSFGETDFSLAVSLAEQAGLAIHNLDLMATQIEKNKMDVDLGLANEIQRMLLPDKFPVVPDLDMASIYIPAQKVGGDLYDVFALDDNRVGIAIADVSGKGIPASLLMAICQSNLRHLARNLDSPAEVLSELNDVMLGEMRPEMFITITYAVLNMQAGEIIFARGGHELPILIHSGNEGEKPRAEFLQGEGMALGMVQSEIFNMAVQDQRIPFVAGDILTLYTDGVTEVTNTDGVEFGNTRLADVLRTLRRRTSEEMTQGILDRISLFSGTGGQSDDLTVVIAKHL